MTIDAELARLTAVSKEEAGDGTLMHAAQQAEEGKANDGRPDAAGTAAAPSNSSGSDNGGTTALAASAPAAEAAAVPAADQPGASDAPPQQQEQQVEGPACSSEARPWYADTPLDLVFAWYNHTDPTRQELIRKYNPSGEHTYGTEPNRLEIMLSLASVQRFAPWVRRVYIVVPPGQGGGLPLHLLAPALLDKIQLVEESEFIPARFLPTFSSIVVESFLHAIPGIAEHFLYMMDDVLFGAPFSRELAFSSTPGIGNVFLMDWPWLTQHPDKWGTLWSWPFYNTGELLRQTFGEKPARLGWHAGYMLTKTAYRVTWALYGEELNRTVQHKFRAYKPWDQGGDIVAHLLVQHTALRLGLQRLVISVEVPWKGDSMGDPTPRLPKGVPRDRLATYGNPDCSKLKGLPKHMLQKGPGTLGVTFANFNKIQHTEEWSWRRLCREAVEAISDGFAPQHIEKGCLCSSPAVGEKC